MKYPLVYDMRSPEEKHNDEQQEIHETQHDPLCPDPRCWRCAEMIEAAAAKLCSCGHDLEDEHRPYRDAYDTGETVMLCDECNCSYVKGEREAFEAKVEAINKAALPKVEAAVKAWVKK